MKLNRTTASKQIRIAQQLRLACEPLENRLFLSVATSKMLPSAKSPLPQFVGPVLPSASQTFSTSARKGGTTSGAGTTPGVRTPTISVGGVVNISKAAGNQAEADIAVNPANPLQIFALSNPTSGTNLFTSRSSDGGVNWTTANQFSGACCDGRAIFDKFGNLYVVYLNSAASSVIIARSTNGGSSFTTILTRSGSWDNPGINAGADGQVWIEVRSSSGPAGIGFRATGLGTIDTSLGTAGFTATQQVTGIGTALNYGDALVCNDGSVLLTWTNSSGQGPVTNGVARDPDGIFGPSGFGSPVFSYSTNVGGFDFIPAQNTRSVDSEPNFAVAPAGTPFAGRVYMVYANEVTNESNNHDIDLRYSDNNGVTWSSEIRVNDDATTRSQFLPSIACDPTTGAVICSWHDARNDNGVVPNGTNAVANDDAQFFGGLSTDGGLTWTNFMIDSGWTNAAAAANGVDLGDWTGSDFYNGHFFAVWASNSTNMSPAIVGSPRLELVTSDVLITGVGATASISGSTYDDVNGNGVRDSEPALNGVTVYLDMDNSGTLNGGDVSTVSSGGGLYSFDTLASGTYRVRVINPAGRRTTQPASGLYTVILSGTSVPGNDFGFVDPRLAGKVYDDTNDNGAIDGSESGKSGVTVYLDLDSSNTLSGGDVSTTTAVDGSYSLGGLANGTYTVRIVNPAGYRLTFPGGGSYTHTISNVNTVFASDNFAVTNRVRINGFVYKDNNGNGSKAGGETGIAGVRVFQDTNNNSIWDTSGSTVPSSDVPKSIVDSAITTSTLNVSGAGNINTVTVTLNISHTFDSDMILTLISPQGTQILLVNRRGGSGDNFSGTTFDDTAGSSVIGGVAPFSGSFQPEVALAALAGENANGTWTLKMDDQAASNTGTLNSWSITLGTSEPSVLSAGDGSYSFTGLTAGSYNIRQEAIANYIFTNPASGGQVVSPASGVISDDNNFGNFLTSYSGSQFYLRLDGSGTNVQVWIDDGSAPSSTPTWSAAASFINAAPSSLTFTGTSGDDALTVDTSNGNPVPTAGVTFNAASHGANGDTLTVLGKSGTAETFVFNSGSATVGGRTITESGVENVRFDGAGGGDSLTVNGGPSVQILATQHLSLMDVENGASAHVLARSIGGKKVIVTDALVLNGTGTLDLDDNDMIVNNGNLTNIVTAIKNARAGGAWTGNGLGSTAAKNRPAHNTSLGAMPRSDFTLGSFNGETLAPGQVLIKYTYLGDANFNGKVDGADFGSADFHFGLESSMGNIGGWANGDFDYNDKVDGSDFGTLDFAFGTQLEQIT